MTATPVLRVYRDMAEIAAVPFDVGPALDAIVFRETDRISFEIEPREPGLEYRLMIGDDRGSAEIGRASVRSIQWEERLWFASARGISPLTVSSRAQETDPWGRRIEWKIAVRPTKLSEERYAAMLAQIAELGQGLLLDLVSKSRVQLAFQARSRARGATTAAVELRRIEITWNALSVAVALIADRPETTLRRRRVATIYSGLGPLSPVEVTQLAARGIDARRITHGNPVTLEREVAILYPDLPEHRLMARFLATLATRAGEISRRAAAEQRSLEGDRRWRDRADDDGISLYERFDRPRLARLAEIETSVDRLRRDVLAALRLPVFEKVGTARAELSPTPIFQNMPAYNAGWLAMVNYLRQPIVWSGTSGGERAKSSSRLYEQWIFLQIAAALAAYGLACDDQSDFVHALEGDQFAFDLRRGTRIQFHSRNGRRISLRYEPWILPREMARDAGETVYRGTRREVAWSPDVLLEFHASAAAPSGFEQGYAVVVDAKYSRGIAPEKLRDASKYLEIRSSNFGHKVVRQVWLAYPAPTPLELEDDAVEWTVEGPTAPPTEEMLGKIGLMPEEGVTRIGEAPAAARDFVGALLRYVGIEEGMKAIRDPPFGGL